MNVKTDFVHVLCWCSCSVVCYKVHKEQPCSKPEDVIQGEASIRQPPRHFENDEDESGARLKKAQLEALGQRCAMSLLSAG
jgi:hypothetical protein